jgi:hypothetical protein
VNLRRQLLLVSLLTLILPWAGCQFVRETETALREGQQQMLSGTAQAIADSLSQFPYELLTDDSVDGQVYAHALASAPLLDGYPDDWGLPEGALVSIRGTDGPVRYLFGQHRQHWYVYAEVRDVSPVYARAGRGNFDRVDVISIADDDQTTTYRFAAEAPGNIVARRLAADVDVAETRVVAHWQDLADGYSIEARIPRNLAGPRLGLAVFNTADALQAGITSRSFGGSMPGRAVTISPVLQSVAAGYVQPGWRLIITDSHGWRVATVGSVTSAESSDNKLPAGWMRMVYRLVLEPGTESSLADPAPTGRETQSYISEALGGETGSDIGGATDMVRQRANRGVDPSARHRRDTEPDQRGADAADRHDPDGNDCRRHRIAWLRELAIRAHPPPERSRRARARRQATRRRAAQRTGGGRSR